MQRVAQSAVLSPDYFDVHARMTRDKMLRPVGGSFRDRAGYVCDNAGHIVRVITPDGQPAFGQSARLRRNLCASGILVDHGEPRPADAQGLQNCVIVDTDRVPILSWPSEWCFSQLRDAALLTLDTQLRSLEHGFSLKDASAFNVQFLGARPIFIDILSFEPSDGTGAWVAYRQFCEHFLAPLVLWMHRGPNVARLWFSQVDGLALPLASAMLPRRTWLAPRIAMHVHLHAFAQRHAQELNLPAPKKVSRKGFQTELVQSLRATVASLKTPAKHSKWLGYRNANTYPGEDTRAKLAFVEQAARGLNASFFLDLGANDGAFSELLLRLGLRGVAVERDPECCEAIHANAKSGGWDLLALCVELANPTPSFGWAGTERLSFQMRVGADLVLALALVHHLSIAQQIPYAKVSGYLAGFGPHLVVEHIAPGDPMARVLVTSRPDLADADLESLFGQAAFEHAFSEHFDIIESLSLAGGLRTLYSMKRRP